MKPSPSLPSGCSAAGSWVPCPRIALWVGRRCNSPPRTATWWGRSPSSSASLPSLGLSAASLSLSCATCLWVLPLKCTDPRGLTSFQYSPLDLWLLPWPIPGESSLSGCCLGLIFSGGGSLTQRSLHDCPSWFGEHPHSHTPPAAPEVPHTSTLGRCRSPILVPQQSLFLQAPAHTEDAVQTDTCSITVFTSCSRCPPGISQCQVLLTYLCVL